jgi:hypothetical protein
MAGFFPSWLHIGGEMKMRRFFLAVLVLIFCSVLPAYATTTQELNAAITRTANYLQRNVRNPQVGSVGGEWTVLGLARSGRRIPDAYFRRYFNAVEQYVRERGGVLDARRFTEYSRVILGLTAAGFDPRNVAGFDLTLPLGDFDRTIFQGINGAIFALLALDSFNYEIPINRNAETQATRELFVEEILRRQTTDGGWNLTGEAGNADITGMALQALAKYQDCPEVYAAIERALAFLSRIQTDCGGFSGGFVGNDPTLESAVQVLVALVELEIPLDDPRFVKNGNTVLDNVLSFQNPNGSFRHTRDNNVRNLMSTETGLHGLVAAQRAAEGRNSLHRMYDTTKRGEFSQ